MGALMTTADLDSLRTFVQEIMLNTCSVKRKTSTNDGFGGLLNTWSTVATNVPCRYSLGAPGGSSQLAGRIVEQETAGWRVTVPFNTNVTASDRLVLDVGIELDVVGISIPQTFSTALVCNCAPTVS